MLFRKKPAEERSPQELEIALQEAEMPQKGLKPFLHKMGRSWWPFWSSRPSSLCC